MDDDEVPPLEDMSEILQQAEVIRSKVNSSKGKQSVDPSPRGAVPQKGQGTEKPKEKSSDTQKVKSAEKNVNSTPSKSSSASFGGFKKGFLFGGNSSSKSDSQATSSSPSGSVAKSSSDLPYITKKSTSESRELPEVQQTLSAEAQKIAQNKDEWLTDGLMKKIEANDALFKKLGDPRYVEAVNQFQTDPVRAMEQYKDNQEIQEFLTSFCKVMGEHFTGLADQQDKAAKPSKPAPPPSKIVELNSDSEVNRAKTTPSHSINPNRSETVYTRSPAEGADMSVRSSTNPNQATAEDERRMQEILANPEIRDILMDPQIMNLIETLKFNPDEGARILQNSDLELRGKVNKLVQCGLLQFQG
ncbi:uncharacterized protein LOC134260862 [Saccostrea cucullata]|uniref:uncharacterized protein LOC134260862 n=1 Tax=Saccostrea cuccullata TaxID=36930 RepID=UPI002ED2DDEA